MQYHYGCHTGNTNFECTQKLTPERGFSSFKFLPGSRDTIIVALKSAEEAATDRQTTFITMYQQTADGKFRVVMEETEIPGDAKFEGIEIFGCQ
jgi:soluble calcium-activated nucleotidase 1